MADTPLIPDYRERDDRIRCQTYTTVRRLEGLPHDVFAAYWRDVHGPLGARLPGLGYYVQHHFSRDGSANLWPRPEGVRQMDVVLDGAVEIGFADTGDQARFTAESPVLFGDEFNIFEHVIAYALPQGSRTVVDRLVDPVPNGPDPLHRLHLHLNGGSIAGFRSWVREWAARLALDPAVLRLRLHLPEPYDNARPAPPSPRVDHCASDEEKDIAVVEIGFDSPLTAREFFASEEFLGTVEGQMRNIRSMAVFPVTGVYTYIRDGVMTTAGLRGSRSARLIARIGATNQTRRDVTSLFTSSG
jgi:hypothetical protein